MKSDTHYRRISSTLTDDPTGSDPFSSIEFDFPDLLGGSGTGWLKEAIRRIGAGTSSGLKWLRRQIVWSGETRFPVYQIKAIGRTAKRAAKTVAVGAVSVFRYLGRKWREGAEIHNHSVTNLDDRYARNFYYLRSMM